MKNYILPLAFIFLFSCNDDLDDVLGRGNLSYIPPNIATIEQDDALFNYLALVTSDDDADITDVGCIEFIYPFVLFQYDQNDTYLQQVAVRGNLHFAEILDGLETGHSIGLSYPISGHLIDGSPVEVNSNEELQQSLESCIAQELEIIIGSCNAIVQDCIWRITESDPEESPYIDSFFTLREDGSVVFSVLQEDGTEEMDGDEEDGNGNDDIPTYKNETGTWIFYFIGADLHMNINFGPLEEDENGTVIADDIIKSDWNFDWKINYIDSDKIEIEKTFTITIETDEGETEETVTEQITLEKECEETKENEEDES